MRDRKLVWTLSLAALACALALMPASRAAANPGWGDHQLPPLDLGVEHAMHPTTATYRGEIFVATTNLERVVVVQRFDQRRGAWLPVGGPLTRDVRRTVSNPVLHVTATGELYVAWTEHVPHGRDAIVVARLRGDSQRSVVWQLVGGDALTTSTAEPPVLVDVGGRLWVVYHAEQHVIRLAELTRLSGDALLWRESRSELYGNIRRLEGAVVHRGAIFVLYCTEVAFRSIPGEQDGIRRTGLRVDRLAVAGDPDPGSQFVVGRGLRAHDVESARIATGAGGRPVLIWNYEVGPVRVEELAADGGSFVELTQLPVDAADDSLLAMTPDAILVGVATARQLLVLRIPRDDPARIEEAGRLPFDEMAATGMSLMAQPGTEALLVILPWRNLLVPHVLAPDTSGPAPPPSR